MNKDRGMIKWAPFNSLMNGTSIVNSLILEKSKITKPQISEEEQKILEEKIIESYYCHNKILITYYKDGYLFKIKSAIKKIDSTYKTIHLENKTKLLFKQIMSITNE